MINVRVMQNVERIAVELYPRTGNETVHYLSPLKQTRWQPPLLGHFVPEKLALRLARENHGNTARWVEMASKSGRESLSPGVEQPTREYIELFLSRTLLQSSWFTSLSVSVITWGKRKMIHQLLPDIPLFRYGIAFELLFITPAMSKCAQCFVSTNSYKAMD